MSLFIQLRERALPDGGFSPTPGGRYRTDATCLAILALSGEHESSDIIARARLRLASDQLPDGRVCISPDHQEAAWPTSLAILAWHQSPEHMGHKALAAKFLINSSGEHWEKKPGSVAAHDTSIRGWSWIAGTHSWAEPTALAMMALKIAGYGNHDRIKEAERMLLDRQLPGGGWNYGNTFVFDEQLRPMPMSTGIVLNALRDDIAQDKIHQSLVYLRARTASLQTPNSLAWALLGLGAWNARPETFMSLIDLCLKNQERYGGYDTSSLSLLMVALKSPGGLEDIFLHEGKP